MPAAKRFSRELLATTALRLVDCRGLAALTMRNLASELGTGPMTIYNYVSGRDGLEALLVEVVMARGDWPSPGAEDWRDDVRALSEAYWRTIRAHPQAIPLIITRRATDPSTLEFGERMLNALTRSGKAGSELLVAFRVVSGFIVGFTQAEAGGEITAAHGESAKDITDRGRRLSSDRFPRVVEIAEVSAHSDRQKEFRAGLELVLTGLSA